MTEKYEPTHQPERAITGNCPACGRLCVVFNNHESWPLVECRCSWRGPTTSILNHTRAERVMPWQLPDSLAKRQHLGIATSPEV